MTRAEASRPRRRRRRRPRATCHQDGDAAGATDTGVTDDSIPGRYASPTRASPPDPGLNQEMYDDAPSPSPAWCNRHGGINGRELVIADRDAAIGAYNDQVVESCSQDFAMVGGGAVLDDADNGSRVACEARPTSPARGVGHGRSWRPISRCKPLPNPLTKLMAGQYRLLAEADPEAIAHYGIMTSTFGSVLWCATPRSRPSASSATRSSTTGSTGAGGESNWAAVRRGDAVGGRCRSSSSWVSRRTWPSSRKAMQLVGYFPEIFTIQPGRRTSPAGRQLRRPGRRLRHRRGGAHRSRRSSWPTRTRPPADYLELMERYNPERQGRRPRRPGRLGVHPLRPVGGMACGSGAHPRVPAR